MKYIYNKKLNKKVMQIVYHRNHLCTNHLDVYGYVQVTKYLTYIIVDYEFCKTF